MLCGTRRRFRRTERARLIELAPIEKIALIPTTVLETRDSSRTVCVQRVVTNIDNGTEAACIYSTASMG